MLKIDACVTTKHKIALPIVFLRDIHKGNLSSKDVDKVQNELVKQLSCMSRGKITVEKRSFLNNAVLSLSAREKSNFKRKISPIKNLGKISAHEPTPKSTDEQMVVKKSDQQKKIQTQNMSVEVK